MKAVARRRWCTFSAAALLFVPGCVAAAPVNESVSRSSVTFVDPEKFTDARRAELEPTSSGVLCDLGKFLTDSGARYVPESMKLSIRVTDIDLAGDFELFRGLQADQVRITKGSTRRTSCLHSRFLDSDSDSSQIRQTRFNRYQLPTPQRLSQRRLSALRKGYLAYWLRADLGVLKRGTTN